MKIFEKEIQIPKEISKIIYKKIIIKIRKFCVTIFNSG